MKKKLLLGLSGLIFLSACGGVKTTQPATLTSNEHVVESQANKNQRYILEQIERKLGNLDRRYISKLNYQDRLAAQQEIDDIYNLLDRLNADPQNRPMKEEDFQNFWQSVKDEAFDNKKLDLIELVSKRNRFSVDQVIRILKIFTFDNKKINALEIMYPKVTDKRNGYRILDIFTFNSDKEKAKKIIGSY